MPGRTMARGQFFGEIKSLVTEMWCNYRETVFKKSPFQEWRRCSRSGQRERLSHLCVFLAFSLPRKNKAVCIIWYLVPSICRE